VGVSQHCEFNSNTKITDNFFENCDGETEIISLKSGSNVVRNNLFKECQGSVVLRHGNFNTIENNIFLGNDKEGTGGVRVINNGQWVVNNLFYKCRGEGFRAPLAIMNGIPNSPAFRYVAVSDAVIYGNTFIECAPISFCEGSDMERTLPPTNTIFANNIIYNTKDSLLYKVFDDVKGISFSQNFINKKVNQQLFAGFTRVNFPMGKPATITFPSTIKTNNKLIVDSLQTFAKQRLSLPLSQQSGFKNEKLLQSIQQNAINNCGAKWFEKTFTSTEKEIFVTCKSANELKAYLSAVGNKKVNIILTENEYSFTESLPVLNNVSISTKNKESIKFIFQSTNQPFLFLLNAGSNLSFKNINLNLSEVKSKSFICTDTSAPSNHVNFKMNNCKVENYQGTFFYASKSAVCDSIIINETTFNNGNGTIFNLAQETDKKGYYPVEKMKISKCMFSNFDGEILNVVRSGNDESTMGPKIIFENNEVSSCINNSSAKGLISLHGVQQSIIQNNLFTNCNSNKILIEYTDEVRASHLLRTNQITNSGLVAKDKYVRE
jgi:poly(beta-D-mannuronate) lyase